MILHPYVKIGLIAGAVLLASAGSAWVTKIYYTGKISDMQLATSQKRLEAVAAERTKREQVEKEHAEAETLYFNNLQAKNDEIQALNDRLATSDSGLYIGADCPASGVPETDKGKSGGTSTTAKLNRQSEQWYIGHKRLAAQYEETLKLCQEYVRDIEKQFTF